MRLRIAARWLRRGPGRTERGPTGPFGGGQRLALDLLTEVWFLVQLEVVVYSLVFPEHAQEEALVKLCAACPC